MTSISILRGILASVGNNQTSQSKRVIIHLGLKREDASVVFAECSCKAGKGELCNHSRSIMTLLCHYRLDNLKEVPENVSVTSRIQQWHRPRGPNIHPQPVMNVQIKRPRLLTQSEDEMKELSCNLYEARSKNIRFYKKDDVVKLQENLSNLNRTIPSAYQPNTGSTNTVDTTFGQVPSGSPLSYQLASFNEPKFPVVCSIPAAKQQVGSSVPLASHAVYPDFPLRKHVLPSYPLQKHLCSSDEQLLLDSITISNNNANKIEKERQMQAKNP